jgi:hypothetical protein
MSEGREAEEAAIQKLRQIGYALLVAGMVADVVSVSLASARKHAKTRWAKVMGDLLPKENVLTDLALGFLNAEIR